MKNLNKLFTCMLATVLLVSSCSTDIDREPLDRLSEAAFFRNAEEFKLFANQFYFELETFNRNDIQSDIIRGNGPDAVSNGTNIVPIEDPVWDDSYSTIFSTNFLLQKFDELEENREESAVYAAEAKFFRAYTYFRLLQRFGGVPLITQTLDTDSPELQAPRNTRQEVFAQIETDLLEAITDLPVQGDISDADLGRISRGAAQAFLARAYLFEGTWRKYKGGDGSALISNAVDQADAVINSGEYVLFQDDFGWGEDEFLHYFFTLDSSVQQNPDNIGESANNEFILAQKYDAALRRSVYVGREWLAGRTTPTKIFADMHLCRDGLPIDQSPLFQGYDLMTSEFENRDLRMRNHFQIPKQQYWQPSPAWGRDWSDPDNPGRGFVFYGQTGDLGSRTSTGYSNIKYVAYGIPLDIGIDYSVIRYAEVLLTYAEAVFERDGSISDGDLDRSLNLVRMRAGLPALTNAFVGANNLDMLTEIRRERTVELAWEGFRLDDLRRWHTAHIELRKAVRGVKYEGTEYETDPNTAGLVLSFDPDGFIVLEAESTRLFDENKNYLFPIPSGQIIANPNLQQNPNW
ncbi:RagB/SusD family nutrient uptake outer membrane protein [Maribacter sp. 2304DJ31-5]|uniref:RagB/SusD family nutrient uptake outer membrane protein n=1 Tax=Maribacter sp. 2304DJ31-5 TaxID=3386273 RepID=UPI0039BC540F